MDGMNKWAYDPAFVMRNLRHGEAPALPQGQLALQCWRALGASPEVTTTPSLSCCTAQGIPELQKVCQACAGLLQDRSNGITAPPRQRPWAVLDMAVGCDTQSRRRACWQVVGPHRHRSFPICQVLRLCSEASFGLDHLGTGRGLGSIQQAWEVAGPCC